MWSIMNIFYFVFVLSLLFFHAHSAFSSNMRWMLWMCRSEKRMREIWLFFFFRLPKTPQKIVAFLCFSDYVTKKANGYEREDTPLHAKRNNYFIRRNVEKKSNETNTIQTTSSTKTNHILFLSVWLYSFTKCWYSEMVTNIKNTQITFNWI